MDSKAAAAAAASSSSSSSYDGKGKNSSKASSDSNSRSNRNLSSATRTSSSSRGATSSESCSGGEGDRSGYTSTGSRGRGASVGGTVAASNAGLVPSPLRVYYVVDPKEVMVNKNAFMCPFLARSVMIMGTVAHFIAVFAISLHHASRLFLFVSRRVPLVGL